MQHIEREIMAANKPKGAEHTQKTKNKREQNAHMHAREYLQSELKQTFLPR